MAWRVLRILGFMLRRLFVYVLLGVFKPSKREAYIKWAYVAWARYTLRLFNVKAEVSGLESVPAAGHRPRVFLSNHQSQIDIPVLVSSLHEKIGFVAKKELGRIPLLAYWMREVGCIFIDRSDRAGAIKSLQTAAAAMGSGSLIVFPEGTRSKTGELLPIKSGGLRMALMAHAQIIPVRIRNSRNGFEARAPGTRGPVHVQAKFFAPLDTEGWPDERASWQKVKAYLEECWREGETPA